MTEAFRTIATANSWDFSYGRDDFHNLEVPEEGTTALYLDPIETEKNFERATKVHSGRFMMLVKSDLDNVYDAQKDQDKTTGKFKSNIEPIKAENGPLETLELAIMCAGYGINQWRCLEVINLFDQNLDGVIINFRITEYL